MGQKVNPNGFRLGITNTWDSSWFAMGKVYIRQLREDLLIRNMLHKLLKLALISRIIIERSSKKIIINIYSARPGMVIGKKGVDIEKTKHIISKMTNSEISINISEVRKSEIISELVAQSVAIQLEKRVSFRKAIKRAVSSAVKMKVRGIRINVKGRLGGSEIARMEWYKEGRLPLHTLRSEVRYAIVEANTIYGVVGVKVWIYYGDNISNSVPKI